LREKAPRQGIDLGLVEIGIAADIGGMQDGEQDLGANRRGGVLARPYLVGQIKNQCGFPAGFV